MPESVMWSFLGLLTIALIGSLEYRSRKSRERFTKFADDFKSAFLPAITQLNTRLGSDREVLGDEFNRHRDAAIIFKGHLGFSKSAFEKACREFWGQYTKLLRISFASQIQNA